MKQLALALLLAISAATALADRIDEARQSVFEIGAPGERQEQYDQVLRLLERGDMAGARYEIDQLRNSDGDSAALWELDGLQALIAGEPAAAEASLRKALALAPGTSSVWAKLGSSLIVQAKTEEGRQALQRAIELDGDNVFAHHVLGRLSMANRDYADAQAHYRAAAAAISGYSVVHEEFAQLLLGMNRPRDAVALLQSVASTADRPNGLLLLARAHSESGDGGEAIETIAKATSTFPDHLQTWIGSAGLLIDSGKLDLAIDTLDKGLGRFPGNPTIRFQLANAYQIGGQNEQAESLYRELVDGTDVRVSALNNLALIVAGDAGRRDEAVELARTAVREAPGSAAVKDTLGWILHQNGKPEEALPYLRAAAKLTPDDPDLICHLGIVAAEVEGPANASATLQRCAGSTAEKELVTTARQLLGDS